MAAVNLKPLQAEPAEDIPLPLPGQLPVELLRMIFPDPAVIHDISPASANPRRQKWLAIKSLEPDSPFVTERVNPDETIATLRALSQVSRTFRAVAMPLLWSVCQVRTMRELGALRETLRINPSIAKLIRSFSWVWLMGGDYGKMDDYDEEEGSLLDLAFRDRLLMWEELQRESGQHAVSDSGSGHSRSMGYFYFESEEGRRFTFEAPGWQADDGPENEEMEAEWEGEENEQFAWSYIFGSAMGGDGPDGYGDDGLIYSAAEFLECLVEIIAQLSCLETFAWGSPVSTMPVEVFELLKKLTSLKSLQIVLHTARDEMHVVPYWELAKGVEHLLIQPRYRIDSPMVMWRGTGAQDEESLASFELPSEAPVTQEAKYELDVAIAYRTVVAAVRGGKLKYLHCSFPGYQFEKLFSIPSLLPCWVALDVLHVDSFLYGGAAASLRAVLAHASLCLNLTNDERLLTAQDVQSLYAHFNNGKDVPYYRLREYCYRPEPQPIKLYLPWLRDDVLLAQQVADAWNAVVNAGGEDLITCPCRTCRLKLSGNE